VEAAGHGARQRLGQRGFAHAGHVLDQQMAARQQADQREPHDFGLPPDCRLHGPVQFAQPGEQLRRKRNRRDEHGFPLRHSSYCNAATIFHGDPIYQLANLLGFDAACLGNHEFDYGWAQAAGFAQIAKYPIVTANVVNGAGKPMTPEPYVILQCERLARSRDRRNDRYLEYAE
jgi:hypothetical protein